MVEQQHFGQASVEQPNQQHLFAQAEQPPLSNWERLNSGRNAYHENLINASSSEYVCKYNRII